MVKVSIQLKTTLMFLLVILIIVIIFNIVLLPQIEDTLEKKSFENIDNIVYFYGKEINHQLSNTLHTIEILAKNPIFIKENASSNEILEQLQTTKLHSDNYEDISFIDNEGNVVISTDYQYRGDWKTNKWYQISLNGSSTVSNAYIILRPWKLVIQFFSPVYNNKAEIIGVLVGQMNFNEFWEILNTVQIGQTGRLKLINKDGKYLSHNNISKILQSITPSQQDFLQNNFSHQNGIYYERETETSTIYSYRQIEMDFFQENYWTLLCLQDEDELLQSIMNFRLKAYIIFGFVLFIIVCIGYYISRSIINPIQEIQKGMKKVSKGDLDYQIHINQRDELGELAESFNHMATELSIYKTEAEKRQTYIERLLQQKDEFINQLGHDIKNPLGPLLNLLPIIEKKQTDPEIKDMLSVVNRNTAYMKNLVTKTIQLAQLKSPNMVLKLEDIKLFDEVEYIIETNKTNLEKRNLFVKNHLPKDLVIKFDKLRLHQLITNLLSNAVKYSNDNTSIELNGTLENDNFIVSIKDYGIGMTQDQMKNIFNEFYKADESRHDFESSGLGMSISKQIVEKHGGSIWVESEGLNKGSTFYFSIPFSGFIDSKPESFDMYHELDRILGLNP